MSKREVIIQIKLDDRTCNSLSYLRLSRIYRLVLLLLASISCFTAFCFDAFAAVDEKLADRYRREAIKAFDNKDYREALKQLGYAQRVNPGDPEIFNTMGAVYDDAGKPLLAVSCFLKAIKLDPNFHKGWINLANEYINLERYDNANEVIKKGKLRFKNNKDLAGYFEKLEKICQAYKDIEKLGKPEPNQPYYRWLNTAKIHTANGDFASAGNTLKGGLDKYPEAQPLLVALALNLQKQKKYSLATRTWKLAYKRDPNNAKLALVVMQAQTKSGDLDGLQQSRKEFAAKFPKHKYAGTMTEMYKHYGMKDKLNKLMEKKFGSVDVPFQNVKNTILVYVHKRTSSKAIWTAEKHGQLRDSDYVDLIDKAFDEWVHASRNRLKFKFTDNFKRANIICAWTSDRRKLHMSFAGGVTRRTFNRYGQPMAVIYLLLQKKGFDRGEFYHTVLHEIGHGLGMAHSKDPRDIMYFSTGADYAKRQGLPSLSDNDCARLNRMYEGKWY